jgi:hypothetical protein
LFLFARVTSGGKGPTEGQSLFHKQHFLFVFTQV